MALRTAMEPPYLYRPVTASNQCRPEQGTGKSRRSVIHGEILAEGHQIYDAYVGKSSPIRRSATRSDITTPRRNRLNAVADVADRPQPARTSFRATTRPPCTTGCARAEPSVTVGSGPGDRRLLVQEAADPGTERDDHSDDGHLL